MVALDILHCAQGARIFLPLKGNRLLPIDCATSAIHPPFFEALFFPGQLPADDLDLLGGCKLAFDAGGLIYNLDARIDNILNPTRLRLVAVEGHAQMQKRKNFRVDAKVDLKYRLLGDEEAPLQAAVHSMVNISAGGARFLVEQTLPLKEKLLLEISLLRVSQVIRCTGQVVRVTDRQKDQKEVAVQFVEISPKDVERVIAFCFAEQRILLRDRVRVREMN